MKYVYFVNRFSLKEKTDKMLAAIKQAASDREYEIIVSDDVAGYRKQLERFKDGEAVLTAIGGDGSINLLLNDIADTDNILSYIPYGTGNDFYKNNLEKLKKGIHKIDVIRINERYFLNTCCFGIDADIANDDRFIHNRFIPRSLRYHAGVVHYFLNYHPRKLKITINNEVIEKPFTTVVAANGSYYGGGYWVSPNSLINDGKMEVLLADELDKINMAKVILSMKDASHLKNPAIRCFVSDHCLICADEMIRANIDGETITAQRFELQLLKDRFRLCFDPDFIAKVIERM